MKRLRHRLGILILLVGVKGAVAAPALVLEPPPFIQRVALTDFLLVETNNDVALAPANLLVIHFPRTGNPDRVQRAVALRRASNGRCFVSYLVAVPPGEPGQFRREEQEIEPAIARNVLAVFRHLLETEARSAGEALRRPSDNDDAWILLRDQPTALAGVTLNPLLPVGRVEDVRVYRDLCAGLVGMFVADERNEAHAQLDRFAAAYVESKQLLRR